jgi:hypothetical protein
VCSPGGYEGYLLPRSPLTARLCATAHVAAAPRHRRSIAANIGPLDLMLAVVHTRTRGDQERARALNARLEGDAAWAAKRKRCGSAAHQTRHCAFARRGVRLQGLQRATLFCLCSALQCTSALVLSLRYF